MDTPGSILRSERENQKKTLKDISQSIKINVEYLKAIEDDNYSLLPAPVFIKSYMKLYADELGFKPESVIRYYEEYISSGNKDDDLRKNKTAFAQNFKKFFPSRKILIPVIIILIFASIISTISFLTIKYDYLSEKKEYAEPVETTDVAVTNHSDKLNLTIMAIELTWVSVSVDNGKPKEWLLRPEQSVTLTAVDKFEIKVGNAGGTRLLLNDEDLGKLGPHGKIVDFVLP